MTEFEANVEQNVHILASGLIRAGCLYRKEGIVIPSKTGDFVYEMGPEEVAIRNVQAKVLGEFFSKKILELVGDDSIRDWVGLDEKTLEFLIETNPNEFPLTLYFGIDLCGIPFVINDFNPDRAVVVGYQPEIVDVFTGVYPSLKDRTTSIYDDLIPLVEILAGGKPKAFVLTEENDPHGVAYHRFAERFGFGVGDITGYDSSADVVIRALKSSEIIANRDKYRKLIADLKSGLPVINPLGSFMGGNKGWMTILRAKGLIPEEWFPDSFLIKGGKIVNQTGRLSELADVVGEFLTKRKNYVLKEGFSAGGWKVHIGADLKKWQWESLWQQVQSSPLSWVVESLQPKNERVISVGDQADLQSPLRVKKESLNLIQRIYSVYPFSGFHAEVFGKHGLKVNASGYSFPVSYTDI